MSSSTLSVSGVRQSLVLQLPLVRRDRFESETFTSRNVDRACIRTVGAPNLTLCLVVSCLLMLLSLKRLPPAFRPGEPAATSQSSRRGRPSLPCDFPSLLPFRSSDPSSSLFAKRNFNAMRSAASASSSKPPIGSPNTTDRRLRRGSTTRASAPPTCAPSPPPRASSRSCRLAPLVSDPSV